MQGICELINPKNEPYMGCFSMFGHQDSKSFLGLCTWTSQGELTMYLRAPPTVFYYYYYCYYYYHYYLFI